MVVQQYLRDAEVGPGIAQRVTILAGWSIQVRESLIVEQRHPFEVGVMFCVRRRLRSNPGEFWLFEPLCMEVGELAIVKISS